MRRRTARKSGIRALGIAVEDGVIELYGVNRFNEVMLHGWFSSEIGLAIARDRPACLIAVEEGALPTTLLTLLERLGHTVFIIPPAAYSSKSVYKRQAKECCGIALDWVDVVKRPYRSHSASLQLA